MFNPATLFAPLKSLSALWTTDRSVILGSLSDTEIEPACQKLKAAGAELRWSTESKLRQRVQAGWNIVRIRDRLGRPSIFKDRTGQLVLIAKPSSAPPSS